MTGGRKFLAAIKGATGCDVYREDTPYSTEYGVVNQTIAIHMALALIWTSVMPSVEKGRQGNLSCPDITRDAQVSLHPWINTFNDHGESNWLSAVSTQSHIHD